VCIPVVPAQHYFMGGIKVNHESKTSMDALYAIGETACNGVHGRNRLASNSLLESLVFAKRAAQDIIASKPHEMSEDEKKYFDNFNIDAYADESKLDKEYADLVNGKIAEANLAEGENYV
jgi:L-aspartate oxidase